MTSLSPTILRCAKQVYNNLNLSSHIENLSNTPMPVELSKMQQIVLLFNETKLEEVVKKFIQTSTPNKSVTDFIAQLDTELEVFCK